MSSVRIRGRSGMDLGTSDLHLAFAYPHIELRLRTHGGPPDNGTRFEIELTTVPRTLHTAAFAFADVQRATAVRTAIGNCPYLPVDLRDENPHTIDVDWQHRNLADLRRLDHWRPRGWMVTKCIGVHTYAQGIGQVTAQRTSGAEQARTQERQHLPGGEISTPARNKRCRVHRQSCSVHHRMDKPHASLGAIGVTPVGKAGNRRWQGRQETKAQQPLRRVVILLPTGKVKDGGTQERTHRHRNQRRVQRMAELLAAQHIGCWPFGEHTLGRCLQTFRWRIERPVRSDPVCEHVNNWHVRRTTRFSLRTNGRQPPPRWLDADCSEKDAGFDKTGADD